MVRRYLLASGHAVALASTLMFAEGVAMAGNLTPPAGPVQATMKPLDSIEPRVCINDLPGSPSAVHQITEPGHYYLRADVNGQAGLHGIEVDFSRFGGGGGGGGRVIIDLNGFSMVGSPGSGDAVRVIGTANTNESFKMGNHPNITQFIGAWGGDGLHVEEVENVCFTGLQVSDCAGDGVEVRNSGDGEVLVCGETSHFVAGGSGVLVSLSAGASSIVNLSDIVANNNGGVGVDVEWVDSLLGPVDDGTTALTMRRVTTANNTGDGVRIRVDRRHSMDMRADELMSTGNGGHGVRLVGDRGLSHDMSIDMEDLYAGSNGGSGFSFKGIVARLVRCVSRKNLGDGGATEECRVEMVECESSENSGAGMRCDGGWKTMRGGGLRLNEGPGMVNRPSATGQAATATLENVDVSENGTDGVLHVGGSLTVRGGTFRANGSGPTGGGGIVVLGDGSGNINRAQIEFNVGPGVHVMDHSGSLHMREVLCSSNAGDGVIVDNSQGLASGRVFLERCVADSNGGDGFALITTTGGVVRACVSEGNTGNGYAISGVGHTVIWNTASDNGVTGYVVASPGNSMGPQADEFAMPGLSNPAANFVR